ncbi:hypothetical protein B6254_2479 (plasmid) [Weissella cibaria]|uniref:Uncharacterized protein n=1 Tax=Weissella cibaria TaxID=137591 RepID=A0A2S1KV55_9LACO|nr:hypothetical protein B6254_2479 [Weissella cibaria]
MSVVFDRTPRCSQMFSISKTSASCRGILSSLAITEADFLKASVPITTATCCSDILLFIIIFLLSSVSPMGVLCYVSVATSLYSMVVISRLCLCYLNMFLSNISVATISVSPKPTSMPIRITSNHSINTLTYLPYS